MAGAVEEFEEVCRNAALVHEDTLRRIVEQNVSCEYLLKYNVLDSQAFKLNVPVISYEDIAADVQRMIEGDPGDSILCKDPPIGFMVSSGTSTGKPKKFPLTKKGWDFKVHVLDRLGPESRERYFPVGSFPTALEFRNVSRSSSHSRSGIYIGSNSRFRCLSKSHEEKPFRSTSPDVVKFGGLSDAVYCHLLCGLIQRTEVDYITSFFAHALIHAFTTLKTEWKDLCHDIRTGTLNSKVGDPQIRAAVEDMLVPDPVLADLIESLSMENSWDGIIPKLWPKAKYVLTVVTGAMKPYIPMLRQYLGSGLQIIGMDYMGSEGVYGVNIDPTCDPEAVLFTLLPQALYMEFLRLKDGSLVDINGLSIGEDYELVVTTFTGLYRYKLGDVVTIVSFFHESPQMAFAYRRSAVLTVNTDVTDEQEIQNAVTNACKEANLKIVDFTTSASFSEHPGYYAVYWELEEEDDYSKHELLQKCCDVLDHSFKSRNYIAGRQDGTIGPLKLVTVKKGTFQKLLEIAVSSGSSPSQYKTSRCTSNRRALETLEDGCVGSYRTSKY